MLTAVEGVYKNGKVIFNEKPDVDDNTKVVVTFLEEKQEEIPRKKRKIGLMKGSFTMSDDFDDDISYLFDVFKDDKRDELFT